MSQGGDSSNSSLLLEYGDTGRRLGLDGPASACVWRLTIILESGAVAVNRTGAGFVSILSVTGAVCRACAGFGIVVSSKWVDFFCLGLGLGTGAC